MYSLQFIIFNCGAFKSIIDNGNTISVMHSLKMFHREWNCPHTPGDKGVNITWLVHHLYQSTPIQDGGQKRSTLQRLIKYFSVLLLTLKFFFTFTQ